MEWLHTYRECIYIWCIRILYIVWTCVQYTFINLDTSQFKKWSKADKLGAHSKRFQMRKQLGKERQFWVQTVEAVKALWKCLSPKLKILEIARQVCETVRPKNPKRNGGCSQWHLHSHFHLAISVAILRFLAVDAVGLRTWQTWRCTSCLPPLVALHLAGASARIDAESFKASVPLITMDTNFIQFLAYSGWKKSPNHLVEVIFRLTKITKSPNHQI